MCSCHSIPECCAMFSGVKLSMGLFVLFPGMCMVVNVKLFKTGRIVKSQKK